MELLWRQRSICSGDKPRSCSWRPSLGADNTTRMIRIFVYHYESLCMYVCLSACLSACLPACLSVCLSVCVRVYERMHYIGKRLEVPRNAIEVELEKKLDMSFSPCFTMFCGLHGTWKHIERLQHVDSIHQVCCPRLKLVLCFSSSSSYVVSWKPVELHVDRVSVFSWIP